jgi:hypothetical protein
MLGDLCIGDLDCATCICERTLAVQVHACCLEICPPCFDCDPMTGLCDWTMDFEQDDGCDLPSDYCLMGSCFQG